MNRRLSILQRSIKASRLSEARARRENAAAVPRGERHVLPLDALQASALERLNAFIGSAALQHSVQIATGFCGQEVRLHQLCVRRNIEARSILKTLDNEAFRIRSGLSSGSARP